MDTKKLSTFLALAQEKTYSRAAMMLNYAPATLVGHMRSLENELGVKLIRRKGRQSALTKQGEVFLPYAKRILALHQEAYQRVGTKTSDPQILRVSTSQSLGQYVLGDMLRQFSISHRNCALEVGVGNCAEFIQQLTDNQSDLCFTFAAESLDSATIASDPLFVEDIYLIAHPNHPLAQKDAVYPSDLSGHRFSFVFRNCCYTTAFLEQIKKHGVKLGSQDFQGSVDMVKRCALSNDGISLMTSCSTEKERADGRLVALPWAGAPLRVLAQIIYRRDNNSETGHLPLLIQFAKNHLSIKNRNKTLPYQDAM